MELPDDADFFDVDDDSVFANVDMGVNQCRVYALLRYAENSFVFVPMWRGGEVVAGTVLNASEPRLRTSDGGPLLVLLSDEAGALRSMGVCLEIGWDLIRVIFRRGR